MGWNRRLLGPELPGPGITIEGLCFDAFAASEEGHLMLKALGIGHNFGQSEVARCRTLRGKPPAPCWRSSPSSVRWVSLPEVSSTRLGHG